MVRKIRPQNQNFFLNSIKSLSFQLTFHKYWSLDLLWSIHVSCWSIFSQIRFLTVVNFYGLQNLVLFHLLFDEV